MGFIEMDEIFPLGEDDIVTEGCVIKSQGRSIVIDEVISADYLGDESGWYIEFRAKNIKYGYWKQGIDGGEIYPPEDINENNYVDDENELYIVM